MLTAACLTIALATLGLSCLIAYWVGYSRRVRADVAFKAGNAQGYREGRLEGARDRDQLREQLAEVNDTLDATMLRFEEYVEDHAGTYPPTMWSDAVPPGGQVCAAPMPDRPDGICGMPVESEPCQEHTCRCARGLVGDDTLAMLAGCREGSGL